MNQRPSSASSTLVATTSEDRVTLQRRLLHVLTVSQILGSGAVTVAVTIGGFVVQDLLGEETPWAGLATAAATACGAVLSQVLARLMARRGRRPGLIVGYLVAALGGVVAAVGVEQTSLSVFLCGIGLFGGGQASNLLARYAATDLAARGHQGRAMSRVIFASAFGAILGPLLVRPTEKAGTVWFGLAKYSGPLAVRVCAVRARRDLPVGPSAPRPAGRHRSGRRPTHAGCAAWGCVSRSGRYERRSMLGSG